MRNQSQRFILQPALESIHILCNQLMGRGVCKMLIFVDTGGGGVDEKITHYVDMRMVSLKILEYINELFKIC